MANKKIGIQLYQDLGAGNYAQVMYPATGSQVALTPAGIDALVSDFVAASLTVTVPTPTPPAEVVVAGAASVLGKITTVAAAAEIYVRVPCGTGTSRVRLRIQSDKAFSYRYALARTILNAPTITLANASVNDTVIVNGVTFTAAAAANLATNVFSQSGDDTADAVSLAAAINHAAGVPGVTAVAAAAVVTLTATTATTTQCVTGVGGARITCAQVIPTLLSLTPYRTGLAANNTTAGLPVEIWVDGYPQLFVGIRNDDGVNAATFVVGSTLLAA